MTFFLYMQKDRESRRDVNSLMAAPSENGAAPSVVSENAFVGQLAETACKPNFRVARHPGEERPEFLAAVLKLKPKGTS
jgi:hypothetical protein